MYYLDLFFFFKQKTAYEMRISDWSSDVCSSDLTGSMPKGASSARISRTLPALWLAMTSLPGASLRVTKPSPLGRGLGEEFRRSRRQSDVHANLPTRPPDCP